MTDRPTRFQSGTWTGRGMGSVAAMMLVVGSLTTGLGAEVTLAWDPNPEPDLAAYIVYFGTQSRSYTSATNVGNVTRATVSGLDEEDTTYFFAITAVNTAGLESDYSNEVSESIPASGTNRVPTLSPVAHQAIPEDALLGPLAFTVGDAETAAGNLAVSAGSTNVLLIPLSNIVLGGSGSNRTVTLRPVTNRVGTTWITLTVSDGEKSRTGGFLVSVVPSVEAFDVWLRSYFTATDLANPAAAATRWGDGADPDRDGWNNLMEYALGLDPLIRETDRPEFAPLMTGEGGAARLGLTFARRRNDARLEYVPEVSDNKVDWVPLGTAQQTGLINQGPEFDLVSYEDTATVLPNQPRYIRLRVIKNDN